MSYFLEVQNIVKRYEQHIALSEVSLSVEKGSIFGLLGPNGAGKTTLIRIINQIIEPDSGQVLINGERLSPKHIAHIGYLPEERGLYKNMTVGEQLLYLTRLKGYSYAVSKEQVSFWLNRLQIPHLANKKLQELSKGMGQKVQFIASVVHRPQLLILDEVFSGFDPVNAELIKQQVLYLKQQGTTILFSTHRMESVEELCDSIALIHLSKKVIDGKVADIKRQYKKNIFKVGIVLHQRENLAAIEQAYHLTPVEFQTIYENETQFLLKRESANTNDLLNLLTQLGNVTHFSEVIPSVNDIFMQTVALNEKTN